MEATSSELGLAAVPFNPTEIIDNIRSEKYVVAANGQIPYVDNQSLFRRLYYAFRPLFPVGFRRILQRIALRGWENIVFPAFPLDTTVDDLIRTLWILLLETSGETQIPFIWYWPRGMQSCSVMTHDVETGAGQEFCYTFLELEHEFGIKSSFELVPEVRYQFSHRLLNAIRQAGSEVCVHGLNHDGRLFCSEAEFRRRAALINRYCEEWGATGFRSPVMYRNQNWYDAFEFSYDMSVPNTAHLDPQRGGCCTLFPFFEGNILELPLTTIQDYAIYNILDTDPMSLWSQQLDAIAGRHGLASFLIHPDYNMDLDKQAHYCDLLRMLKKYSNEKGLWLALPGEVDRWWRQRDKMELRRENDGWYISGEGSDRAVIAYATHSDGEFRFILPEPCSPKRPQSAYGPSLRC
jgi:hypothetical protein